jgi:hypothetical protein
MAVGRDEPQRPNPGHVVDENAVEEYRATASTSLLWCPSDLATALINRDFFLQYNRDGQRFHSHGHRSASDLNNHPCMAGYLIINVDRGTKGYCRDCNDDNPSLRSTSGDSAARQGPFEKQPPASTRSLGLWRAEVPCHEKCSGADMVNLLASLFQINI